MDRLLFISLVTMSTILVPKHLRAQLPEATYTIAGDVPDAQNVSLPADQPVTLRDLLVYTGQGRSQGNAFVLRGQPLKSVWSEHFNPGVAVQSQRLQSGDVIVFRELADSSSSTLNVILMTDAGNQVMHFENTTRIQLGQLFDVPPKVAGISVVRTSFESSNEAQLAPTAFLAHGDVIDNRTSVASVMPQLSTSDFSTAQFTRENDAPESSADASGAMALGLTIPGMQTAASGEQNETSPFDLASSAAVVDRPEDSPFAIDDFTPPLADVTSAESSQIQVADTEAVDDPRNGSIWNALFVLGLVFALGLIVIGWVKTQQEREQELETETQLRSRISDTNADDYVANSSGEFTAIPSMEASHVEFSEVVSPQVDLNVFAEVGQETEIPKDITDELWVETEETLSAELPSIELPTDQSDDITQQVVATVDEDCPILSAGSELPEDTAFSIEALGELVDFSSAANTATEEQDVSHSESLANALVAADEWFGADWRTSEAKAELKELSHTESEALLQSIESSSDAVSHECDDDDADMDDTVVEVRETRRQSALTDQPAGQGAFDSAAGARGELEDLIHNRIPMNLQQIQLPLRINLFGKPSGPKRLRIDSAHTQIAPPHMMSPARSGRRPQKMAVAAVQETVVTSKPTGSKRTTSKPEVAIPTNTDVPGLDKALNFLDEQADS